MQQTVNLTAGVMRRIGTRGRLFLIVSQTLPADIAVVLKLGTTELESVRTAGRGFRARVPDPGFDAVELTATSDTALEVILTESTVDFDFVSGSEVLATIAANPLPVSNDRGTPGNLLHVTAVTVNDTPATGLGNGAAVAVGAAAVIVAAANAARRELRLTNIGANPCAIGGAGLLWADRCIILAPGDTWVESRAANLAFYAVCDAGQAASVTAQSVTA